jgi:NADH:ubiquinone oxidoreductase subunit E
MPMAAHRIFVCRGVACTQACSEDLLKALEKEMGVRRSGRTPQGVELDEAYCFGRCAMAPNVKVDGQVRVGQSVEGMRFLSQEFKGLS